MSEIRVEDGIVTGNVTNKEDLKNPISRWLVKGFDEAVMSLFSQANPGSVHEIGCGEGRLCRLIAKEYAGPVQGCDISPVLIAQLQQELTDERFAFARKSIYDVVPARDHADLIICCEVLEHVDEPDRAVEALRGLGARSYLLSVPREPLWRVLNVCRLKYLKDLGNTPGHLNHWSKAGFCRFLRGHGFVTESVLSPYPWTMVLGHFE